jgi:hypothetical protein
VPKYTSPPARRHVYVHGPTVHYYQSQTALFYFGGHSFITLITLSSATQNLDQSLFLVSSFSRQSLFCYLLTDSDHQVHHSPTSTLQEPQGHRNTALLSDAASPGLPFIVRRRLPVFHNPALSSSRSCSTKFPSPHQNTALLSDATSRSSVIQPCRPPGVVPQIFRLLTEILPYCQTPPPGLP